MKVKIIPLVLLLAGCGGGGGGSGEDVRELSILEQARVLPYPLIEAANTRASQNPPYMSGNEPDAFRADFYPDFSTSDIRPLRGIVHATEPAYVTTEFDGTDVKVHVDPVDTPDFTLDTATDTVEDRLARSPPGVGNAAGFSPAENTFLSYRRGGLVRAWPVAQGSHRIAELRRAHGLRAGACQLGR